jgi:hypothetical protein
MTREQYHKWLRAELVDMAAARYPDDIKLQMIYQLGFLEQQLASAMNKDSRVFDEFTACIKRANKRNKEQ